MLYYCASTCSGSAATGISVLGNSAGMMLGLVPVAGIGQGQRGPPTLSWAGSEGLWEAFELLMG